MASLRFGTSFAAALAPLARFAARSSAFAPLPTAIHRHFKAKVV
jgi:hypothetical protein